MLDQFCKNSERLRYASDGLINYFLVNYVIKLLWSS